MPDTWVSRLRHALGPGGYVDQMRRSVQSVVLYEAFRGVEACMSTLRPFQRKAAYLEQCTHLLKQLVDEGVLLPHQSAEIMYRTMSSQAPLDGTAAITRHRGLQQELEQLAEQIKPFWVTGRSHEEAVDRLAHHLFVRIIFLFFRNVGNSLQHTHSLFSFFLSFFLNTGIPIGRNSPRPTDSTHVGTRQQSRHVDLSSVLSRRSTQYEFSGPGIDGRFARTA